MPFCDAPPRVRVSGSAASSLRHCWDLREVSRRNKMAFAPEMTAPSFRLGSAATASPAASGLPQYSEDLPLPFYSSSANSDGVGVFCTGPNEFEVQAMIRGQRTRFPGFSSIATATEAFRRMQDGMSPSPAAGAPELSRAPVPAPEAKVKAAPEPEPEPAPEPEPTRALAPAKLYKGVYFQPNGTFQAVFYPPGATKAICRKGFRTAELAADAYDDAVRGVGGNVVNTPRHPGEIQAVPGKRKKGVAPEAAPAAPARDAPDAQLNKRKRGRPRKVVRNDGAAAPASPASAAAAAVSPSELAAAAASAAQFRGVTAISGGGGFFAWLSYCSVDGTLMRRMLGAFGTAEEAAHAVDAAARWHSQLEQLNFPTPEERALMGRQTRSSPYCKAGRQAERKMPQVENDDAPEEDEVDKEDDWQPRGSPRRRIESPAQVQRDADALDALAEAALPPAGVPEALAASTLAPSQSPPVTPDPLTIAVLEAPAPAAPPPSASQLQQNDDVVAFLRSISPPLRCLDAAVAAVPGSGVSMRQLRQLPLMLHSTVAAAYIDRVAKALHIEDGGDKLDLLLALDRLAGP